MNINNNHNSSLQVPQQDDILAFIIAIKSGSIQKMKQLLHKYKGNLSNKLQSQLRQPPLYFAVIHANEQLGYEMAKQLIIAGANPNFKDANQQTVMFYCCRDGKRKLTEYLISEGVKLDQEDLYGQTPLFYVASENRINLLDLFTSEMISHVDKLAKQTALYYAARKGHLGMCKALIEKGCDINHMDSSNKSAIEYAKKFKFQQVVDFLCLQSKKARQVNRVNIQNIQQSDANQANKRKKKQNSNLNMNKNNYKISVLKQGGEVHDLTEDQVKELFKTNLQLQGYLTNPDSIPQELLESTLQETWEKIAIKIITLCWKLKGSHWFHDPVDPVKFGIMDYFDIIAKPMDFTTIKKKLNYNAYNNPQQFVSDMRQIFKNCYIYNGQNHQISACAKQIEALFEQSIKSQGLTKFL